MTVPGQQRLGQQEGEQQTNGGSEQAAHDRGGGLSEMKSRHLVLAASVALLGYARIRQPIRTWGATQAEAASPLPGDELVPAADGVTTRAIDIDAPPADVWPWLAQMGPSPRGGAYTYDWIENVIGLNMQSVDRVLPEFQHPQVGDTIELGSNRMRLELVDPLHALAWRSGDGNWVWTFVLGNRGGGTRLISRNRFRLASLTGASRDAADGTRLASDGASHAARNQAAVRRARGTEHALRTPPSPSVQADRQGRTTTHEQDETGSRHQPERRDRSARSRGRKHELEQRDGVTKPFLKRAQGTVPMIGGDESPLADEGDHG